MQDHYKIVVPDKYSKVLRLFNFFLFLINSFGITWFAYKKYDPTGYIWSALILLFALLQIKNIKTKSNYLTNTRIGVGGFLLSMLGWWLLGYPVFAFIVLMLGIAQIFLKKNVEFLFSPQHIIVSSFLSSNYSWKELQNVVLKDDLLTLDFKNNKIIQTEILAGESNIPNEKEFNEFCSAQLKAHSLQFTAN